MLYGVSMGGAAALRAIINHDIKPVKVVLESVFDSLLNTTKMRFDSMGIPSFPSAQVLLFWGGIQQGVNLFEHNPSEYSKSVSCPVLILHGEKDSRVTKEQTERIFDGLKGAKKVVQFEGLGHEVFVEKAREKWVDEVQGFLKE